MCDTLVALPPSTAAGVVFGKNSDRERNEAQAVEMHPAAQHPDGAVLQTTRVAIPQARRTRAVLISRPYWMWGAEIGANDAGVVIGNEAVHSTHAPNQQPALLGMDLLRLGLERAETAAEACTVIAGLLRIHGQGGNCGHLHPHFYHNSFIVADAREAFVLETVGRDHAIEQAAGIRTISNAYSLTAMRTHADATKEQAGDAPTRCARTDAMLRAHDGQIGPAHAMAALRDHGPAPSPVWHPQDTRGRTVCMHAGAGDRRGQTVASMVSELRPEGAIHWITGTAAPCTSIFKPVTFAAGLPDCGPAPSALSNPASLWWRHEQLHRALLRDANFLPNWLISERDTIEARFIARTRRGADASTIAACWAEAEAMEAAWAERLGLPAATARPDFAASWSSLTALAGA